MTDSPMARSLSPLIDAPSTPGQTAAAGELSLLMNVSFEGLARILRLGPAF